MKMKKILALALAALLLVAVSVGGTMAWLVDGTEKITNTFTTSNVGVELSEDKPLNRTAKMIPGHYIIKDPEVKLTAGSEDSYVFVKITESSNFDDYMAYDLEPWWTVLPGYSDEADEYVIYRTMTASDDPSNILFDNQVWVRNGVTKEMMEALNEAGAEQPTLSFQAYAVQMNHINGTPFTPDDAWKAVSNPDDDPTLFPVGN